jgi:hypothetical protein
MPKNKSADNIKIEEELNRIQEKIRRRKSAIKKIIKEKTSKKENNDE